MSENEKELIVVVGYGWVGQANALALIKLGYAVAYYDTAELATLHYSDEHETYARIQRVQNLKEVDGPRTYYVVCVGDFVSEDRDQDISRIQKACESLRSLQGKIVLRSTVLPQKLKELNFDFYVPEFLHEKNAVDECLTPYYCVVGTRNDIGFPSFLKVWEQRAYRSFRGTPEEASYIKYLSNIWNSIRIAFVNEFGDSMVDPKTQEDVQKIERVIDFVLEQKSYLRYGQAFDGHCLPKDTRAFIGAHVKEGKNVDMLIGTYSSNEHHKKLQEKFQSLPKVFSFWDRRTEYDSALLALWGAFNKFSTVRSIRKQLRFIMDAVVVAIPERSIRRSAEIWEEKAKDNPFYYAHTYTRSGKGVTEKELCETGKSDYEQYILGDPVITSLLFDGTKRTALDFGTGVARMTVYFANDFARVEGLDVSPTMIDKARARVDDNAVSLRVFNGENLPYEGNVFDHVFSFETLQYVPTHVDIERYLREFYRVLKKNGIAKIQLRGGRGVKRWDWSYGASYLPEEAIRLAERCGFTVLGHQVIGVKYIWLTLKK